MKSQNRKTQRLAETFWPSRTKSLPARETLEQGIFEQGIGKTGTRKPDTRKPDTVFENFDEALDSIDDAIEATKEEAERAADAAEDVEERGEEIKSVISKTRDRATSVTRGGYFGL